MTIAFSRQKQGVALSLKHKEVPDFSRESHISEKHYDFTNQ